MSTAAPKTVRLVPITLLADLAKLAVKTLDLQQVYFRAKHHEDLLNARDAERRLSKAAHGALDLVNSTPDLFAVGDEPADDAIGAEDVAEFLEFLGELHWRKARPFIYAADVADWLETWAEAHATFDPDNLPPEQEVADAQFVRRQVLDVAELITEDPLAEFDLVEEGGVA